MEDLDSTEKAEEILDSLVSEQSKTEIEDSELLKTIVNVCNKEKKRTDQEDETKRNFKKKLEEKEQEIDKLKERNRELRKNNILLETEKEILEDKIKQDSMNIKRYKKAIIKLNNIANVVKKSEKTEKDNVENNTLRDSVNTNQEDKVKEKRRRLKCKYEDRGKCKEKDKCMFIHSKRTCFAHSRHGMCSSERSCSYRHPVGIFYEWEQKGSCFRQETCRFCHPQRRTGRSFLGQNHGSPPLNPQHPPDRQKPPFLGFLPPKQMPEMITNQMKPPTHVIPPFMTTVPPMIPMMRPPMILFPMSLPPASHPPGRGQGRN